MVCFSALEVICLLCNSYYYFIAIKIILFRQELGRTTSANNVGFQQCYVLIQIQCKVTGTNIATLPMVHIHKQKNNVNNK